MFLPYFCPLVLTKQQATPKDTHLPYVSATSLISSPILLMQLNLSKKEAKHKENRDLKKRVSITKSPNCIFITEFIFFNN
jgi:hypothetical protein